MMILGGIVISDDDMPESIPIGGTLESKDVKLSDGSRILKVTGFTPNDFKITGFMRGRDATGDPLTRFEAIEQMCRDHLPQTLIWKGVRATRSYPVIVQVVNGNIIENSNISYDITLFRQSNSGLVYSGYTVAPTRNEQITGHMGGLARVKNTTGAGTQGKIAAAQTAASSVTNGRA